MFLSVLYEYVDLEKNLEILTSIFKEGGLIKIQIKGGRTENLRGSWIIFLTTRISFFIILKHFCLTSKMLLIYYDDETKDI